MEPTESISEHNLDFGDDTPPTSSSNSPPGTEGHGHEDDVMSNICGEFGQKGVVSGLKKDEECTLQKDGGLVAVENSTNKENKQDYFKGSQLAILLRATEYFAGGHLEGRRRRHVVLEKSAIEKEKKTSKKKSQKADRKPKRVLIKKEKPKQIKKPEITSVPKKRGRKPKQRTAVSDTDKEKEPVVQNTIKPVLRQPWFLNHELSNDIVIKWQFFDSNVSNERKDLVLKSAYELVNDRLGRYITDDPQFEPQQVELLYPLYDYQEKYLLVECKPSAWFNPVADAARVMELTALVYFPEDARKKVVDLENPDLSLIKNWDEACEKKDTAAMKIIVEEYNNMVRELRSSNRIIEHIKSCTVFPQLLVHEIMNQCYLRAVLPDSRKLKTYKAFSNYVYGELMPAFLSRAYNQCGLSHDKVFIDLGSGVGNCTIQAALEFGCESYGVEIMDHASDLCKLQWEEFDKRCAIWGVNHGPIDFFLKQSFVENAAVQEIVNRSDVILVNNYLFDATLSKQVIRLLQGLKSGTKIISLKPIVPHGYSMTWDDADSILNRMKSTRYTYEENSVSWTSKGGFYYITEVLDGVNEDLWVLLDEVDTLLDVLDQSLLSSVNHLLLGVGQITQAVDLLDTVNTQSDLGGEELDTLGLVQWRIDERALDNVLFTSKTVQDGTGKSGTGLGHGQSSGTCTALGLDNLVTAELNSVDQSVVGLLWQVLVVSLRYKRNDGDTRVSTNNRNNLVDWVGLCNLRQKSGGSQNVQGGDTKQFLWIVHSLGLQNLGHDRNGGVDRVGNNQDGSVWRVVGSSLGQVSHNGSIGVEQVISGHTWLSWNTSRNKNNIGTVQSLCQSVVLWSETSNGGVCWDVGNISGNTSTQSQVVQGQLGHLVVQLHQQRQWLSNTSGSTKNRHLVGGGGGGGEMSSGEFSQHDHKRLSEEQENKIKTS